MADPRHNELAFPADALEHDDTANVKVKRVGIYNWNPATMQWERGVPGLYIPTSDSIDITYDTLTDTYTYKYGSTTVAVVVITYSDDTKALMTNVSISYV